MNIYFAAQLALYGQTEPFWGHWNASRIRGRDWSRLIRVEPVWDHDGVIYRAIRATIADGSEAK